METCLCPLQARSSQGASALGHSSGLGDAVSLPRLAGWLREDREGWRTLHLSRFAQQSFQVAYTYAGRRLNLPKVTEVICDRADTATRLSLVLCLSWFSLLKMPLIPFLYKNKLYGTHISSDIIMPTPSSCPSITVVDLKQSKFYVFSQVLTDHSFSFWFFFNYFALCVCKI